MTRSTFIAYIATLAFIFLIPFFSIPSTSFNAELSKVGLVMVWGAVVSVVGAVVAYKKRVWTGPLQITPFGITAFMVLLVAIASAFVSPIPVLSFFGQNFASIVPLSIAMLIGVGYVTSVFAKTSEGEVKLFITIFWSLFIPVCLVALSLIIAAGITLPSSLTSFIANSVGKWNDIALFALVLLVITVSAIRRFALEGIARILVYVGLVSSVVILLVVNLRLTWYMVAVAAIISLITLIMKGERKIKNKRVHIIMYTLGIVLSLVYIADNSFTLFGGKVSNIVSTTLNVSAVEVYPSFTSTAVVAKEVLAEDPLFGVGPDRFNDAWKLHRSENINLSEFWSNTFSYGGGLWPTFVITMGIVGGVAVLAFILMLIFVCVSAMRSKEDQSPLVKYVHVISSLSVLIMTAAFFVYAPGFAGLIVYAVFVGILAGCFAKMGNVKKIQIPFASRHLWIRIGVIVITALLVIATLWIYGKKVVAEYYYTTAAAYPVEKPEDLAMVAGYLDTAIRYDARDVYLRSLASVMYNQFTSALTSTTTKYTDVEYQQMLDRLVATADASIIVNPFAVENYLFSAELFRLLAVGGVDSASAQAMQRYTLALEKDPHNPSIPLLQARVALQSKDNAAAQTYLESAIAKKPNYTEAVFLLSQLLIEDDNAPDAIKRLEARASVAPAEPIVFFQLGFMKYGLKDYAGAAEALEPAVMLVPEYANALYFLGLSYYELDRISDATAVFNRISYLNPDNKEVASILTNLKSGKPPFGTAVTPPEKRDDLPVDEETEE